MTHTTNTTASIQSHLSSDHTVGLSERSLRARTEPMTVRPLRGARYVVETESGGTYVVDLRNGTCTCPDHAIRGARCKHYRRVWRDAVDGRIGPPEAMETACSACGGQVSYEAGDGWPPLCSSCRVEPGALVRDRESGDPVLVVDVLGHRADEEVIPATGWTVADHPTNRNYGAHEPVVAVVYPTDATGDRTPRRYSFPITRLTPM